MDVDQYDSQKTQPLSLVKISGGSRCNVMNEHCTDTKEKFLTKVTLDKGLIRLLTCMGEALRIISSKVIMASCGGTACVNSFGDEQPAVDMLVDKLLFEYSGQVGGDGWKILEQMVLDFLQLPSSASFPFI